PTRPPGGNVEPGGRPHHEDRRGPSLAHHRSRRRHESDPRRGRRDVVSTTTKEDEMKIVVIGGTGLIGSKLVEKRREAGHHPLAASPDTGVNTITCEGLAEAFAGADVGVDVANAPDWEDSAVMDFFLTSTRNTLAAEAGAGVKHHLVLSVVGTDRLPDSGYLRAKLAQEETVKAAAVPYSILPATQFFQFI